MEFSSLLIACTIYSGLNLLAFAVFACDKLTAKTGMARCPENLLLLFAGAGPAGALAAMMVFRHKTRHIKFFLVPVFFILHLFLLIRVWQIVAG